MSHIRPLSRIPSLRDAALPATRDKRTVREVAKLHRRHTVAVAELPWLEEGEHASLVTRPERKRRPGLGLLAAITAYATRLGPIDLTVATFSISLGSVRVLLDHPQIRSRRWILDAGCTGRGNANAYQELLAARDEVRLVESHMKVAILQADDTALVISGSANLGRTQKHEQLEIVCSTSHAEAWLDALLDVPEIR